MKVFPKVFVVVIVKGGLVLPPVSRGTRFLQTDFAKAYRDRKLGMNPPFGYPWLDHSRPFWVVLQKFFFLLSFRVVQVA